MIIFIFGITVMVGFLIYYIIEFDFDLSGLFFSFTLGILGVLLGSIIIVIVVNSYFAGTDDANKVFIEKNQTQLVALKDNFQTEGTAFLLSASVNDKLKYTYIYETQQGMTTGSVDVDKCYIKYTDENTTPYIQEWEVRCKSDTLYWLFLLSETRYTIYLPEGSVIQNVYEINLE